MTIYSLSYLTVALADPVAAVRVARATGYGAVGLRCAPAGAGGAFSPLRGNPSLIREVRAACAGEDIQVLDLEIIRIGLDFSVDNTKEILEVGEQLGVTSVTVVSDDFDIARATNSFAQLCETAETYGLNCGLEIMPRTGAGSVLMGLHIVNQAGRQNGRLLFDPLHAARTKSSISDLSEIPARYFDYLQVCDAPKEIPSTQEGLLHTARSERLLPGEGGIDLKAMFEKLPSGLPISVEIPNVARMAEVGVTGWAEEALVASKLFMETLGGKRSGDASARGWRK